VLTKFEAAVVAIVWVPLSSFTVKIVFSSYSHLAFAFITIQMTPYMVTE